MATSCGPLPTLTVRSTANVFAFTIDNVFPFLFTTKRWCAACACANALTLNRSKVAKNLMAPPDSGLLVLFIGCRSDFTSAVCRCELFVVGSDRLLMRARLASTSKLIENAGATHFTRKENGGASLH